MKMPFDCKMRAKGLTRSARGHSIFHCRDGDGKGLSVSG
ncbi:hypothetical protein GRAN_2433 [Granulicella sibirica]|uniref:Uncharacterized protein n=1 Tax=Granulicella sibirica TaxID=2479048 RepID=A0A4Q0T278_9BACT|nr:hypothetical protein GRAN_2433 [Granulicella sibirica]